MPTLDLPKDRELPEWPRAGSVAVLDLEYTAWEGSAARAWSAPSEWREIVQMGAVLVNGSTFSPVAEFEVLVKPMRNAKLSEYFQQLTGITQARVDASGSDFAEALRPLETFIRDADAVIFSGCDGEVLRENCAFSGVAPSHDGDRMFDFRPLLSRTLGRPIGDLTSSGLPALAGLPTGAGAHSALHDCRAIAVSLAHWRAAGIL